MRSTVPHLPPAPPSPVNTAHAPDSLPPASGGGGFGSSVRGVLAQRPVFGLQLECRVLYIELALQASTEVVEDLGNARGRVDDHMCAYDIHPARDGPSVKSCTPRTPGASRTCRRTSSISTPRGVAS